MPFNKIKARLALENGTIFSGYGFGAISENSEGKLFSILQLLVIKKY